jgi:hypothetical protein
MERKRASGHRRAAARCSRPMSGIVCIRRCRRCSGCRAHFRRSRLRSCIRRRGSSRYRTRGSCRCNPPCCCNFECSHRAPCYTPCRPSSPSSPCTRYKCARRCSNDLRRCSRSRRRIRLERPLRRRLRCLPPSPSSRRPFRPKPLQSPTKRLQSPTKRRRFLSSRRPFQRKRPHRRPSELPFRWHRCCHRQ